MLATIEIQRVRKGEMLATIGIPRCEKIGTRLVPYDGMKNGKVTTGNFSVGTIAGSANAIGQAVRQIIDTARILPDN